MTRGEAFELLKKYNSDPFHIRHAITVEAVDVIIEEYERLERER